MPVIGIPFDLPIPGNERDKDDSLNVNQLADLWRKNGGAPGKARLAGAVAFAESRGKRKAVHKNSNGTVDRGYWQINSIHGALSTTDGDGNARAAITISKNGTDWTPWVTFNKGDHKKFLNSANPVGGDLPDVAAELPVISDVGDFLKKLNVVFDADWWLRVGKVFLGILALVLAANAVIKEFLGLSPTTIAKTAFMKGKT